MDLTEADGPSDGLVPRHIAIIMDGNRRWAKSRGLPPVAGHREGANAVRRAVEACGRAGVRYLTLYAFSSENWGRPADEVGELMNLMRIYLRQELNALHEHGVRVRMIGERERFAPDILEMIANAEAMTRRNDRLDLIVALNYGGRREIVNAARRLAREVTEGRRRLSDLTEAAFEAALYTSGIPDPDLLVRTSGEQRISNFLLWQLAYTELVFLPVPWPEFGEAHLRAALSDYARRERRYGADAS